MIVPILLLLVSGSFGSLPFDDLVRRFEDAHNSLDMDRTLSLFDDNACMKCSGSAPPVCGKREIVQTYSSFFSKLSFLAERAISPVYNDRNASAAFIKAVAISPSGSQASSSTLGHPVLVSIVWNDRLLIQDLLCVGATPPYTPVAPAVNFSALLDSAITAINNRDGTALSALFEGDGCAGRIATTTPPYACGPEDIAALLLRHSTNITFLNALVISPVIVDGNRAAFEILGTAITPAIANGAALFVRKINVVEVGPTGKIIYWGALWRWA